MPMRGELAIPAVRQAEDSRAGEQCWIVIGCCAIGFVAALDVALCFVPVNQIGILIAQYAVGG